MSLQEQIIKVLDDNINRTPKDIYKQIIKDKDYFFTTMNPESSIKNLCLRMYKKELIECQIKDSLLHYYTPTPPSPTPPSRAMPEEEETQKIVVDILYHEEERNKISHEQQRKKNQCINSVIIGMLCLVAFGFNYYK